MLKRIRMAQLLTGVSSSLIMALLWPATPGMAYSGRDAASYAETWWNDHNSDYMYLSGDDCTNFVSQAMHSGGGYPYRNKLADSHDDHNWWASYNVTLGFNWSHSFTVSQELYNFLMLDHPGGSPKGSAHSLADQTAKYTPDSVVTGDPLFYDWQGDGTIDHATIQVGIGQDDDAGPGWYGNYVDQHTNDRKHAFWSLQPYNSQWMTTTIHFVHVYDTN